MAQLLNLQSYAGLGRSHRVTLYMPIEDTLTFIGSGGGSMVKVGRSFSQPFVPRNVAVRNGDNSGGSFPIIDSPEIQETAANMPYATQGGTTSNAIDVASLLAAVGGEQMHYIEFNSMNHEPDTRQQWPLQHLASESLDQPERSANVAKPVVLHNDGVAV
jgi:hypothetical protein